MDDGPGCLCNVPQAAWTSIVGALTASSTAFPIARVNAALAQSQAVLDAGGASSVQLANATAQLGNVSAAVASSRVVVDLVLGQIDSVVRGRAHGAVLMRHGGRGE